MIRERRRNTVTRSLKLPIYNQSQTEIQYSNSKHVQRHIPNTIYSSSSRIITEEVPNWNVPLNLQIELLPNKCDIPYRHVIIVRYLICALDTRDYWQDSICVPMIYEHAEGFTLDVLVG